MARARRAFRRDRGQASVELVAVVPVLLLVTLVVAQLAVAGYALWSAAAAARAGARAGYVGGDAEAAAGRPPAPPPPATRFRPRCVTARTSRTRTGSRSACAPRR